MSDEEDKQILRDIRRALIGDEFNEGLVKKVDRHESWIQSANGKFYMVIGGATVVLFLLDVLKSILFHA